TTADRDAPTPGAPADSRRAGPVGGQRVGTRAPRSRLVGSAGVGSPAETTRRLGHSGAHPPAVRDTRTPPHTEGRSPAQRRSSPDVDANNAASPAEGVSSIVNHSSVDHSIVDAYLDHLAVERGLAANTIAAYRRDLQRYVRFLAAAGAPFPSVDERLVT